MNTTGYSMTVHLRDADQARIEGDYISAEDAGTGRGFATLKIEDLTIFVRDEAQLRAIAAAANKAARMIKAANGRG